MRADIDRLLKQLKWYEEKDGRWRLFCRNPTPVSPSFDKFVFPIVKKRFPEFLKPSFVFDIADNVE